MFGWFMKREKPSEDDEPSDEPRDQDPAAWWDGMDRVVTEMEGRGEPVQAVGQILLES